MKRNLNKTHFVLLFLLIQLISSFETVSAQLPTASNQPSKTIERLSIKSVINSRPYISIDLRFSIALSEPTYSNNWIFQEGVVAINLAKAEITGGKENIKEFTKLNNNTLLSKIQGKVTNVKYNETGDSYSSVTYFTFDNGKFGIRKFLLDDEILFILFAQYDNSADGEFFYKAFETFKVVNEQEVKAEIQRKFEEATPQELPQDSKLQNNYSDAKYENLKGKVMKIVEENESVSDDPTKMFRKPSQTREYNKTGNLIRTVRYDYRGNPSSIEVYGFIDGKRVSKYGYVKYPYNPPPPAPPPPSSKTEPKRDLRYSTAYENKYSDGNLVETLNYANNGNLMWREVLSYKESQIEALLISSNGKPYRKSVSILDKNGFEIEETSFDIKDDNPISERKFKYSYEFDNTGNWIKRISYKDVVEDGKTVSKPVIVYYRNISYYK